MPRFRFGLFDFDPATGTLSREGLPVRLQPQPARVLALLVERAGVIVSREELRQRVWGSDTFVDFERGLNFCIAQIRSALADTAGAPRYIETLPRRGYRFIAPVHVLDDQADPPPLSDATPIGPPIAPSVPARPWILRPALSPCPGRNPAGRRRADCRRSLAPGPSTCDPHCGRAVRQRNRLAGL